MTLTTFNMEKEAKIRMMNKVLPGSGHNPLSFMRFFLPKDFPGRVVHLEHRRSEYTFNGKVLATIMFDQYGQETIEMEAPGMAQDIDIFEAFAKCILTRLEHLGEGKRKHLSMLANNLYKGVLNG